MVKEFKDIISVIASVVKDNDISGLDSFSGKKAKIVMNPKKSLSRSAMDGIANFPVLVDDAISVEEGMMIARSLEKRFATFLMIVMSMDPVYDLSRDGTNMRDYLKQFHQNMNVDGGITPKYSLESVSTEKLLEVAESLGKEYEMYVTEDTVDILHTIYEGVNIAKLNKEGANLNFSIDMVTESKVLNDIGRVVLEAKGKDDDGYRTWTDPKMNNRVIDAKFEKANDTVPTLLHVRVFPKNVDVKEPIDFIIGVHATLHPVSQTDMVLNLVRGLKNDDKFFNFVRWTTGETKFFKDFLFGIDQMKLEAVTNSGTNNAFFNMGRRRKELASIKNRFTKNDLMPNMTLVVTTDCLERIRQDYGYDITMGAGASQISLIRKLMNTYFLLGFVIVDQGLSRVNFMYDGESKFDAYTYANLQRENSSNDKQFKETMKLMGRSV